MKHSQRRLITLVAIVVLACFGIAIVFNSNHNGTPFVLLCITVIDTAVGYNIGAARGRPALGLVLGFLLSIVGWLIVGLIPQRPSQTLGPWG